MRLKNRNVSPEGGFRFYYVLPKGGEAVIPSQGSANGIKALASVVRATLPGQGIPVPANLEEVIEHQICLRQRNPRSSCWNSGAGDALHHDLAKPLLETFAKAVSGVAPKLAVKARKLAGCSHCGGTRTYDASRNNLGRAGKLNKLVNGKVLR